MNSISKGDGSILTKLDVENKITKRLSKKQDFLRNSIISDGIVIKRL